MSTAMQIYLDTNIWIYAHEKEFGIGSASREFILRAKLRKHVLASSLFVLGELLVPAPNENREFQAAAYRKMFSSPEVLLLPYTLSAANLYARLRGLPGIKPLDALHLAAAGSGRVDLFVTEDTRLLKQTVPGIGSILNVEDALGFLS